MGKSGHITNKIFLPVLQGRAGQALQECKWAEIVGDSPSPLSGEEAASRTESDRNRDRAEKPLRTLSDGYLLAPACATAKPGAELLCDQNVQNLFEVLRNQR